jgi:AcrR family transcriptional regulator
MEVSGAASSSRPRQHSGSSDAEVLILQATEELLADVPVGKLSVAQIIERAGVSRATFYFYFGSKYAVITALLKNVMDEIYEQVQPFVNPDVNASTPEALRASLEGGARVWRSHRFVLRATSEHWTGVPELRVLWTGLVKRFTDGVAAGIDHARAAGDLPEGADSRRLAAALLWGSERAFHVAGLEADEDLGNEEEVAEALIAIWTGALYGVPS